MRTLLKVKKSQDAIKYFSSLLPTLSKYIKPKPYFHKVIYWEFQSFQICGTERWNARKGKKFLHNHHENNIIHLLSWLILPSMIILTGIEYMTTILCSKAWIMYVKTSMDFIYAILTPLPKDEKESGEDFYECFSQQN